MQYLLWTVRDEWILIAIGSTSFVINLIINNRAHNSRGSQLYNLETQLYNLETQLYNLETQLYNLETQLYKPRNSVIQD